MRLRLSNRINHNVAFEASDAAEFGRALAGAWCCYRGGNAADLHVQVAGGDWLSPSYAIGRCSTTYSGRRVLPNMPVRLERGAAPDVHLWAWCETAYADAGRLNRAIGSITDWADK